jgi:hypothetical protein
MATAYFFLRNKKKRIIGKKSWTNFLQKQEIRDWSTFLEGRKRSQPE